MRNMLTVNNQKGFTLLELLVAVSLMAIGLLAVVSMQAVAINSNSIANRSAVATAFGQGVMDEILARPITDALLNTSTGGFVLYVAPTYLSSDVTVTNAGIYRARVWTRTNTPTKNVTRIDVIVNRQDTAAFTADMILRLGTGGTLTFTAFKRVV